MMVLVTYDVRTADEDGPRRLRRVAKICVNHGVRVQKSVFECKVTPAQRVILENDLREAIDEEKDSIRLYDLGSSPSKITHIGAKEPMDVDGLLMF
ncbi:MAG: CRISPR-associated endonuclease Cas2 [Thermoplasmata archaeon]|nr:CRISPR-associated endonuclease Cas2 [Thermoplasmata archaeon]